MSGASGGVCLLDLGNTRYKWMERDATPGTLPRRRTYPAHEVADGIATSLLASCRFDRLLVASVKGASFDQALQRAFRGRGIDAVRFLALPRRPSLPPAYRDPRQFGIDRYLNLLGARARYPLPLLVVDAGTAVTFDLLDRAGRHAGGCIFPGLALLRRSLGAHTAGIAVDDAAAASLLGDSTQSGVNGGTLQGWRSAARGIVAAMTAETGNDVTIILTGGDAQLLGEAFGASTRLDSTLLFRGMREPL